MCMCTACTTAQYKLYPQRWPYERLARGGGGFWPIGANKSPKATPPPNAGSPEGTLLPNSAAHECKGANRIQGVLVLQQPVLLVAE